MNRVDPFNEADGLGDGTVKVRPEGWVDKYYGLWNRNPMVVSAEYMATNGVDDGPQRTTLPSY